MKLNSITTERENVGTVESVSGFVTQFGSTSTSDLEPYKADFTKWFPLSNA